MPAEEAGVCRHGDEIELVCPGELSDLCCRIARQQNSPALTRRKLGLEERIKFVSGKVSLLFGNLGRRPYIELHRVVTVEIEDVKQCHPGPENSRPPFTKAAMATQDGEKSTGNRMFWMVVMGFAHRDIRTGRSASYKTVRVTPPNIHSLSWVWP